MGFADVAYAGTDDGDGRWERAGGGVICACSMSAAHACLGRRLNEWALDRTGVAVLGNVMG